MSQTLASEIKATLGWLSQDVLDLSTVSDSSKLDYHATMADGTGDSQADKIWYDLRTLAAGTNEDLILLALPMTLFGDTLNISMVTVKAILLVNTATTAGENLIFGGAASHEWQGPFAAAAESLIVPADSCLLLLNKKSGWAVSSGTADQLRIANGGSGDISYQLAILGTSA